MNNYCTNCGKRLKKNEFICKNCQTPIVKNNNNTLIIVFIILLFPFYTFGSLKIFEKIKQLYLQYHYVEPFVMNNLNYTNYNVEFLSSGKCIVSGNCKTNYFAPCGSEVSCDGTKVDLSSLQCKEYKYLENENCIAYYYSVKINNEDFKVTVYYKDNKYHIVKGVHIYGN